MDGSVTAIWIICVVAVAGLAIWLVGVALAARSTRPPEHAHRRRLRGSVQGGIHVSAGGRSVAPRRDEPVVPGEVPGDSLHPGGEDTAEGQGAASGSGHRRQDSVIPPD
jgi:hypothetical protein